METPDEVGVGVLVAEAEAEAVFDADGDGVGVRPAAVLTVSVVPAPTQDLPATNVEVGDGVGVGVALLVADGVGEDFAAGCVPSAPHPVTARTATVRPATANALDRWCRSDVPPLAGSGLEKLRRKSMGPPGNHHHEIDANASAIE